MGEVLSVKKQELQAKRFQRAMELQENITYCTQVAMATDSEKVKDQLLELAKDYAEDLTGVLDRLLNS